MKINILYVITQLELGGAQKQLLGLIKNLDKDRYNIFLFTARDGFLMEEALAIPGLNLYRSRHLRRPIDPWQDFLALMELKAFILTNRIDMVHTHSSKAGILGRWAAVLAKTKVILHTVHGWSFNDFQKPWTRQLYIWLEKFSAKFTDRIVVVSDHDKKKGLGLKIGFADQYNLIRYGISRAEFGARDASIRGEFGFSEDMLVIGTIACFKPQKGLEDFVELAALAGKLFPQVRFLMVGDGVLRKKLERQIEKAGLRSRFVLTGWRTDAARILSAMDVFVLTSLWEGLPIAVLEAMASGIPVLATDTGGIAEVISEGETGFLVPCHDVPSMLKKLTLLLREDGLKKRIALRAAQCVDERFETKTMVKSHEELYRQLIGTRGMTCDR